MNDYSDILEGLNKDRFKAGINRLLNESFIVKSCKDTETDYRYIRENQQVFEGVLDLLGYRLIIDAQQGVIAVNTPGGTGRSRFSKNESIILLILRLLYIEKRRELSLVSDVQILIADIFERYEIIGMKQKLRRDTLRTILGKFKRLHLVYNLDRMDVANPDIRLIIYPSIMLAVQAENLDGPYAFALARLEEYANGGEANGGRDTADNEEADED